MIVGGVNMFATNPISNHTQDIDNLVDTYINFEYVDVSAELLINILEKTGSYTQSDFNSRKYIACIKALQEKRPTIKCRLIVRVNRE